MSSSPDLLIPKISALSQYVTTNPEITDDLQQLTQSLYEFGTATHSKRSKTAQLNKKARLKASKLITDEFGSNEIWSQISDRCQSVMSTVDTRLKQQKTITKLQSNAEAFFEAAQLEQEEEEATAAEDTKWINDESEDDENDKSAISDDGSDDGSNDGSVEYDIDEEDIDADAMEEEDVRDDAFNMIRKVKDPSRNFDVEKDIAAEEDNKEQEQDDDDADILGDMDSKELDRLETDMDAMEDFIDQQWGKEMDLTDPFQDDIEQRALIYEDEQLPPDSTDAATAKDDKTKTDDEFDWLTTNTAIDSDIEADNDDDVDEETEAWDSLFNVGKFADTSAAEAAAEEAKRAKAEAKAEAEAAAEEAGLSRFEKEEKAIRQRINELEEANLAKRSWEYRGETSTRLELNESGDKRPRNSMLQTYVDFDYSDKLKPIVTEDVTSQLEATIISRIQNEDFDDVERKIEDPSLIAGKAKRKLIEVSDQKSSMGLAELYERQYLQQVENSTTATDGSITAADIDPKLAITHEKLARMKADLFYNLDQLCRFHYAPKAATIQENVKVRTHTSALFMEEMLPSAQTTLGAVTMAPEQIYEKPKIKYMVGDTEMTRFERRTKRRENKRRGIAKQHLREEKSKLRSKYDSNFKDHLSRIKAMNEVRTHALAAAKKDGFLGDKDGVKDTTKYTNSAQMFASIQKSAAEAKKRKKAEMEGGDDANVPASKRHKSQSLML